MQLDGHSFRKENIYSTHISGHTFDQGYIYFFMVAAASPSMRSCYFIGTPAASFQKNISTLQPLHSSRSSGRHRSFHCQRGYGKSVFACLVRGGDYIMCTFSSYISSVSTISCHCVMCVLYKWI